MKKWNFVRCISDKNASHDKLDKPHANYTQCCMLPEQEEKQEELELEQWWEEKSNEQQHEYEHCYRIPSTLYWMHNAQRRRWMYDPDNDFNAEDVHESECSSVIITSNTIIECSDSNAAIVDNQTEIHSEDVEAKFTATVQKAVQAAIEEVIKANKTLHNKEMDKNVEELKQHISKENAVLQECIHQTKKTCEQVQRVVTKTNDSVNELKGKVNERISHALQSSSSTTTQLITTPAKAAAIESVKTKVNVVVTEQKSDKENNKVEQTIAELHRMKEQHHEHQQKHQNESTEVRALQDKKQKKSNVVVEEAAKATQVRESIKHVNKPDESHTVELPTKLMKCTLEPKTADRDVTSVKTKNEVKLFTNSLPTESKSKNMNKMSKAQANNNVSLNAINTSLLSDNHEINSKEYIAYRLLCKDWLVQPKYDMLTDIKVNHEYMKAHEPAYVKLAKLDLCL